jgi:hypothetical protein
MLSAPIISDKSRLDERESRMRAFADVAHGWLQRADDVCSAAILTISKSFEG